MNSTTLWDAAARAGGKASAFVAMIEAMRSGTRELPLHPQGAGRGVPGATGSTLPLPEIIDHVLEQSGLIAHYRNETGAKKREAEERLENLNELVNAATLFVHENEDDSLTAFLAHASLEAGEHQAGDQDDALHLMTVHAAKGLEFHTVFITGLEEGLFPHQNSQNVDGGLDEERRLMYVAITRARRRLYLTFAQRRMLHGQASYSMASSFLRELPDNLLHWITPAIPQRDAFPQRFLPPRDEQFAGAAQSYATASGWRSGQAVVHPKFGEGMIVNLEGSGADARVQVNFRNSGVKWLALEYAKLTAV